MHSIKQRMNAAMDMISELPEAIIHHILFFMPAKDAARTSILSKTWKTMWNSLHHYEFFLNDFWFEDYEEKVEAFTDYVDKTLMVLHEQKVIIENFRLLVILRDDSIVSRINQWIELANKNHIKRLDLNLEVGNILNYTLTPSTFVANSLVSLSLKHCKFTKSSFCDDTKFCCLRELKVVQVSVDDEEIIQTLLSICPFLEMFILENPLGVENLQIFNLPRLMEAKIYGVDKVEIKAPKLRSLVYRHHTRLPEPLNLVVTPPNRLRNLTIRSLNCTPQSFSNLISKLPFLEILELDTQFEELKISSIRLRELRLFPRDMNLRELEIDTPNLRSYIWCSKVIPSVFTINGSSLQHVEITAQSHEVIFTQMTEWLVRLGKHLKSFKKVDLLTFQLQRTKDAIDDPVQLTVETIPPLPNVKHLKLESIPLAPGYSAIIDALLWNFHPAILSIPPYTPRRDGFMKLLYKELMDQEKNKDCCNDYNIKCWRHYLKGFEFVSLGRINKQDFHSKALSESLPDLEIDEQVIFELKW